MSRYFSQGFTLIELMIVVAILGILAAIAYPSYTEYVRKGNRAEGRAAVLAVLQQQERFMTQNNRYLAFASNTPSIPMKQFSGENSNNSAYDISAAACNSAAGGINTCVSITATPRRADPKAGNLTASSDGTRSCTGSAPETCWR